MAAFRAEKNEVVPFLSLRGIVLWVKHFVQTPKHTKQLDQQTESIAKKAIKTFLSAIVST
jgi:hypothetical protein